MIQTLLELETLKSEKLRMTVLIIVFMVLFLMWVVIIAVSPKKYHEFFGQEFSVVTLPGFLAFVAFYFVLIRYYIIQFIQHKKNLPTLVRYLNAFVEVSIPTLAIIIIAHYKTPVYALLMPAILAYFIFIILSSLTLNKWLCLFSGAVAAIEYLSLSFYIIHYTDVSGIDPFLTGWHAYASRGALLLVGGAVTGFITVQIKNQFITVFEVQKECDRIESIFGQHVSPEVVSKLLSKNANASEYVPVCIMFLDLRNFTNFTEQNKPDVVVNFLNHLFEYMVEIIHNNKGIINKFLGDGFMAVFGAPVSSGNDVANAVQAALEIIKRTNEETKDCTIPDLKIGIGLHYGYAITGTIGTKRRLEYTIVGDVVNSTAHIEQLNKTYNTSVLISEDAFNKISGVHAEFIGSVTLKHRDTPIKLYKLR